MYNNWGPEQKKGMRSSEGRKITSAKSTAKRVVVSTKNLLEERNADIPKNIYFEETEVVFNNKNLQKAFSKKKKKKEKAADE